jgi:prepilin-type N-terminal cleavage/methylation domain-containing protein
MAGQQSGLGDSATCRRRQVSLRGGISKSNQVLAVKSVVKKIKKRRAFTLIELVTAVALLALVLMFSGIIFKVSIESYRTASANAEIMQKLRVITEQLNADFRGLCKDAPLFMCFYEDSNDSYRRCDQIMFFAVGDFQSTQLYSGSPAVPSTSGVPVRGNVARISYICSPRHYQLPPRYERERMLIRRQHILTADRTLDQWPDAANIKASFMIEPPSGVHKNERYEHDSLSLSQWKTIDRDTCKDEFTLVLFMEPVWIDMANPDTYHKLMCNGVGNLAIQWAYRDPNDFGLYWFPSSNPDGSGTYSHFYLMDNLGLPMSNAMNNFFGIFLNVPNCTYFGDWFPIENAECRPGKFFDSRFYPAAFKFTFTLYDSKNIIKGGRPFTHIVYLD